MPPAGLDDIVESFDHTSVAVWDIAATLPLIELLGGEFRAGGDVDAGFRWIQFHLPGQGKLELVQPLDPDDADHFLVKFLQSNGPGLHHLTFKVHDIRVAAQEAERRGYEVVGLSTEGAWKEAFIHPRTSHGVLIQLAEFTPGPHPPQTVAEVLAGTRGPDS
jgi:methylmalonyl-CoA/ethylmalonyl-CoA epimerase